MAKRSSNLNFRYMGKFWADFRHPPLHLLKTCIGGWCNFGCFLTPFSKESLRNHQFFLSANWGPDGGSRKAKRSSNLILRCLGNFWEDFWHSPCTYWKSVLGVNVRFSTFLQKCFFEKPWGSNVALIRIFSRWTGGVEIFPKISPNTSSFSFILVLPVCGHHTVHRSRL